MERSDHRKNPTGIVFFLIFIALAAGILAGGYFAFRNYEQTYRVGAEHQLSAIAELKVNQLVEYRKERLGDATILFKNPAISNLARRLFGKTNDIDAQHQLHIWLSKYTIDYQYDRVFVLDSRGVVRMTVPVTPEPIATTMLKRASEVLRSSEVTIQDFYRDEHDQKIYLALLVPIIDDIDRSRPLGVLVLRIDPTLYLYPFIQTWPMPSRSSETLIVRREGNDALFLNELRFQKNTALNLRTSLSNERVAAVRAVLGEKGIIEGVDYRGVRVIADVRPVPGSPWFLVARMDRSEVYEPARAQLWLLIILVGALIAAVGAGVGFVWRHERNRFYREQFKSAEALRESESRFRSLFENMAEGVALHEMIYDDKGIPVDYRIVDVNGAFEKHTGIPVETARGALASELYGVGTPPYVVEYGEVVRSRKPFYFETYFSPMKKDFSISTISPKAGHFATILLDITERKHTEAETRRLYEVSERSRSALLNILEDQKQVEAALTISEVRYRRLFEAARDGILILDADTGMVVDVNPFLVEMLGYSREAFFGKRIWELGFFKDIAANKANFMELQQREYIKYENLPLETAVGKLINAEFVSYLYQVDHHKVIQCNIRDITERKRVEEALRESQSLYHSFIEQLPNAVFRKDREGRYVLVNPHFCRLKGLKKEDFIGRKPMEVAASEIATQGVEGQATKYADVGEDVHEQILQTGKIFETEEEYLDADGGIQQMYVVRMPVFDSHRTIIGTQGIMFDVSERKRAEEALHESELKYRELFENAQVGMYRSKLDGSALLAVNSKLCEIIGYSEEEMLGNPGTIRWADPQARDRMVTELRQAGSLHDYTIDIVTKSGEIRSCSVSIQLNADKGYIEGSAVDITERKRYEEEIRALNQDLQTRVLQRTAELTESEERFRQLAEASYEAIIIHEGGVLLRANDQFFKLFGFEPGESLGKQVMSLTTAPQSLEVLKKQIDAGGLGPYEATGLRKDGTTFPMEIRARHMEYKGRPVRVAAIMDITERKQAEEALRERTAALEIANKELEAFSYSVSHDLRAPLRAIDGFSRIVLEEYANKLDAEGNRLLNVICANTQKMDELITDILDLSRVSRNEMTLSRINMTTLANSIYHEIASPELQKQFSFSVAPLPDVYGDPSLMRQVWRNVISNAVKFTAPKDVRTIEIGGGLEKGICTYFIKDTGVGFDPKYTHKLFGVFQRLHKAEDFEGTGVGLAIVQRIIHRHGGRVWAEGKVGEGAVFYFTIPARQQEIGNSQ